MDRLKAMQVFVSVVREGGFAQASRELGMSTSSVSRHVSNLEDALEAQLLHRTTRALKLTQIGEEVLEHCEAIVSRNAQMLQERQAASRKPAGRLRLTMPHFMAATLMQDAFALFSKTHADVELEIVIADRSVPLVEEGFDMALRVGRQPDSSLTARKFIDLQLGVIGTPAYFAQNGIPETPADLLHHNCIIDTAAPYRDRWPFRLGEDHPMTQRVSGNLIVNGGAPARDLVLGGAGLAYSPEYLFHSDVEHGRVTTVLDQYAVDFGGIYIVYPPSRHRNAAVLALTEFLLHHAKPLNRYREAVLAGHAQRKMTTTSGLAKSRSGDA